MTSSINGAVHKILTHTQLLNTHFTDILGMCVMLLKCGNKL
jgi:hypothetical protein